VRTRVVVARPPLGAAIAALIARVWASDPQRCVRAATGNVPSGARPASRSARNDYRGVGCGNGKNGSTPLFRVFVTDQVAETTGGRSRAPRCRTRRHQNLTRAKFRVEPSAKQNSLKIHSETQRLGLAEAAEN
jgi:hypothetical protein